MSSDCCRAAVAALDRALDDRPDKIYHDLAEVVRCLVLLRTELTACNGVLSTVIGGEYPLAGLRRDRLHKDRNELASLFDEA